ncbi:hypothetical protein AA958_14705 [Streptomyces sp. CNQ-509]|uniref:DUF6247 family protein n=1 Tax=unclassified Streptomyces TaxID=2593676 RepID=UPI00062DED53|nr:DUF6247 family protein [Streptomyces sp. CNQ-509]AKH86771.1 hypothetical protein AA958_14705 [Streptomyces sp. CNQ-509]
MTEQHITSGPLISMPALTPAALRTAIAQIAPAQLPAFAEHLDRAAEQASAQSTITPLRAFLQYWGEFVAIQRNPERAARLRDLEAEADTAESPDALAPLVAEIQQILGEAQREVAG